MTLVGYIVHAIWIGVPIALLIFGMIDLGKAVIASKEDEVKKATKAFGKKIPICSWGICSSMVSFDSVFTSSKSWT